MIKSSTNPCVSLSFLFVLWMQTNVTPTRPAPSVPPHYLPPPRWNLTPLPPRPPSSPSARWSTRWRVTVPHAPTTSTRTSSCLTALPTAPGSRAQCSGTDLLEPPALFWNCSNCSRKCCDITLPAASVTERASSLLFWNCPPCYLKTLL